MRVLHVLNSLRRSGAEVMLHCAAPLWSQHGVECEIVAVGPEPGAFAADLANVGYRIHWLADPGNRRLLPQFAARVREGQYDVIHLHVERANFWLAMASAATGRHGLVQSLHGQFSFHGALRVERTVQRAILRRMGVRFVAVAPGVAATEWARFRNRARVITNWCDTARFAPAEEEERSAARRHFGVDRTAFVITSVGNCSAVKNHASLIEALCLLQARHNDVVYLHAGDHSGETGSDERRLADELDLGERVRFLGTVGDVQRLLHATDLFVMPSLHEGMGIAAIEAMAAGVPVVLADCDGLRDIARITGQGLLTEPTPSALAERIQLVLARPRQSPPSQSTSAADEIRARFAPQRGVAAYAELYRAVTPHSKTVDPVRAPPSTRLTIPRIGVLVASHNRRDSTLACLRALDRQANVRARLTTYLVDDASRDGTADAVRDEFPSACVLEGSGELFWAGAMYVAEQRALLDSPDFLLWLNDDVVLEPGAVAHLLETHDQLEISGAAPALVVGATKDDTGQVSYGGVRRNRRLRRMSFSLVEPNDRPQLCATMNGNVVLIPVGIVKQIGGLDRRYRHGMADFDFGLRAAKAGFPVWLSTGWVGTCAGHPADGSFRDPTLPSADRARILMSLKGIPPREWLRLTRRHAGAMWPVYFVSPYVRFAIDLLRRHATGRPSAFANRVGRG